MSMILPMNHLTKKAVKLDSISPSRGENKKHLKQLTTSRWVPQTSATWPRYAPAWAVWSNGTFGRLDLGQVLTGGNYGERWWCYTNGQMESYFTNRDFPWNKGSHFPYFSPPFGKPRSCEVAINVGGWNLPPFWISNKHDASLSNFEINLFRPFLGDSKKTSHKLAAKVGKRGSHRIPLLREAPRQYGGHYPASQQLGDLNQTEACSHGGFQIPPWTFTDPKL